MVCTGGAPARPPEQEDAAVPNRRNHNRATSLVELVAVIAIVAILAGIAVSRYRSYVKGQAQKAFVQDMRVFLQAAEMYHQQTGEYLEDSGSGTLPRGWADYVDVDRWLKATPVGGCWDFEKDSFGIKSGFGVHFIKFEPKRDPVYMREIDGLLDDGILETGRFRRIAADRYYYIIEG